MSFDLDSFLASAVGQIPDAGEQTASLKKLMEQRLRAEYEHPRVKEFEFCLQQSFPPERIRHVLFHPSPEEFRVFPLLLRRAPEGAPAEHPQNTIQLTALSLLHLVHCKSWELVSEFILHGGLDALVRLFCSEDMFCRGQAVETFLQVTSHPDFDWFEAPTWHQATSLHAAMLNLANPALAFIGSLISNVPSPVPGVGLACLEILGFWLSWARKLHTKGNPLHVSRILLEKLQEIGRGSVAGHDELTVSSEEAEFARRLYEDFSRFPTAEEVGAAEHEMLDSKSIVPPTLEVDVDEGNGSADLPTSAGSLVVAEPPLSSSKPAAVPKKNTSWTMNEEDRDTYVWVLAAMKRRAGFGGSVVGVGEGSTEFDSKTEEALLARSSSGTNTAVLPQESSPAAVSEPVAVGVPVVAALKPSSPPDDGAGDGSGKTAAAYMAEMNKKRINHPTKPAAASQPLPKPSVSLAKVWRTTGPSKLGEFASKLRDVGAAGLVNAVGETLDESLLLGIVQAIAVVAKDDADMAAALFSQLPSLKRMATTLTFLSTRDMNSIRSLPAVLPSSDDVDAAIAALSRLGLS